MNTAELWTSQFGNDYTKRNQPNLPARAELWRSMLPKNCHSVLEVGANSGQNLKAISCLSGCDLFACEPNATARKELHEFLPDMHIRPDFADSLGFADNSIDLVFTSGVLIHVPPDKLAASLNEIHRVAKHWIICAEYFAPHEEMIPYREHDHAMWRRDYGSLYLDAFNDLRLMDGYPRFVWRRTTGLDNLMIWAFEKHWQEPLSKTS